MKIQYTLPGYEPEITPLPETGEENGLSFDRLMRASPLCDSTSWKQALSLDRTPGGPTHIGPPPGSREFRDVQAERLHWRQLLSQHLDGERGLTGQGHEKVMQMLDLLDQAQQAADEVWAHTLDGAGGQR